MVATLVNRGAVLNAAKQLRGKPLDLSGPTSQLPTDALVALRFAADEVLKNAALVTRRGRAGTVAAVHEVAALRHADWASSALLFFAWVIAASLAYATWEGYKNPSAKWRDVENAQAGWSARFPARTSERTQLQPGPGVKFIHETRANLGRSREFSVLAVTLDLPDDALDQDAELRLQMMRNMVAETARTGKATVRKQTPVTWQGHTALEALIDFPNRTKVDALYVASGNVIYLLVLGNVTDPALRREFRESFTLTR